MFKGLLTIIKGRMSINHSQGSINTATVGPAKTISSESPPIVAPWASAAPCEEKHLNHEHSDGIKTLAGPLRSTNMGNSTRAKLSIMGLDDVYMVAPRSIRGSAAIQHFVGFKCASNAWQP